MFYTPRGMKIRVPLPHGFALMARLYPERTPDQILRTAEGIEFIPTLAWEVTLVAVLVAGASFQEAAISSIATRVLTVLLVELGLFIVPGLHSLSLAYSYIPSILRWVALPVLCWWLAEVAGLVAWLVAWLGGALLQHALEFAGTVVRYRRSGRTLAVTSSELCFFHAYRLHASALERPLDLNVSPEELEEANWKPLYLNYMIENPQLFKLMGAPQ